MNEPAAVRDLAHGIAARELSRAEQWLRDVDAGQAAEPLDADPGASLTAIYNLWVEAGGQTARRKNRHSINLLRELLGDNVPSAYPKLAGNMLMSDAEYAEFLRAFFSHWSYEAGTDKPLPIFGKPLLDSSRFAELVAQKLLRGVGSVLAKRKPTHELAIRQFFEDYSQTDGCIIISSATGTIPRQPGEDSISPFLDVIARAVQAAHEDFLLIFVIDRGVPAANRSLASSAQFLRFINRERVRTHLDAVRLFGLPKQAERGLNAFARRILPSEVPHPDQVWQRFNDRCCVVERKDLKEDDEVWLKLGVASKHFLPSEDEVPEVWLRDPNTMEQLFQRPTLSAQEGLSLVATVRERRVGTVETKFWVFPKNSEDPTATRVEPLQSPGEGYVLAAELIYRAARRVMRKQPVDELLDEAALEAIRRMSFEVYDAYQFVSAELS
jgi:hypothetical protein